MPRTQDITNVVFSGEGVFRHTDERYYRRDRPGGHDPHPGRVPLIVEFLSTLSRLIDDYYRGARGRISNYEDLYYVARQIADCETHEYDNPAVLPFCRRLRRQFSQRLKDTNSLSHDEWDLGRLADETCNYVADLASDCLSKMPRSTEHIAPLLRAFCEVEPGDGAIVTLNHDIVIETALNVLAIPYNDGFSSLTTEISRWDAKTLAQRSARWLLKLHGSVEWQWLTIRDRGPEGDFLARIALGTDYSRMRLPDGTRPMAYSGRPVMLVGTHNKILRYSGEVFLTLFCRFNEAMQASTALVVCGYGFRDKGINRILVEWLLGGGSRTMTIVHRDPDALLSQARGAVSSRWESWLQDRQLRLVPKHLEELDTADLEEVFTISP